MHQRLSQRYALRMHQLFIDVGTHGEDKIDVRLRSRRVPSLRSLLVDHLDTSFRYGFLLLLRVFSLLCGLSLSLRYHTIIGNSLAYEPWLELEITKGTRSCLVWLPFGSLQRNATNRHAVNCFQQCPWCILFPCCFPLRVPVQ